MTGQTITCKYCKRNISPTDALIEKRLYRCRDEASCRAWQIGPSNWVIENFPEEAANMLETPPDVIEMLMGATPPEGAPIRIPPVDPSELVPMRPMGEDPRRRRIHTAFVAHDANEISRLSSAFDPNTEPEFIAEALHLSGVLRRQSGNRQGGVRFWEEAVARFPNTKAATDCHTELGHAYKERGELRLALAAYRAGNYPHTKKLESEIQRRGL